MSKSAQAQEPSMEEILASIRRIISDDNPNAGAAKASPQPPAEDDGGLSQESVDALLSEAPARPAAAGVLELTKPVETVPPGFTPVRGPDVMFREEEREQRPKASVPPPPAPAPVQQAAPSAPRRGSPMRDDDLLSPTATAAVSAAFNSLATTILSENSRTLEDLVREMMRPMLKEWLDENLPGLVERMVRAEIERVSRGGR